MQMVMVYSANLLHVMEQFDLEEIGWTTRALTEIGNALLDGYFRTLNSEI